MTERASKSVRAAIEIRHENVERPLVEGKPPTAFRIWRAGANETDHGTHYFTRESAALLMTAQALRGNLVSVDVDHMSLNENAPPEVRKAVGWHVLSVRDDEAGEPECWAEECEWTDVVAPGLAKDPPEWRYFSPAYDVDPETNEIVRYLNTALTNNPATWRVTTLASVASQSEERMSHEEILAALKKMAEGDDEDGNKAKATLAALEPKEGGDEPKPDAEDAPADEKKEAVAASAGDEEDAPASDEKKATSVAASAKPAISGVDVELAKLVGSLASDVAAMKANDRKVKRAAILASRTDLAPALLAVLAKSKLETVERVTASIPKPKAKNLAAAEQPGVLANAPRGDETTRAPRLSTEAKQKLDERMGVKASTDGGIQKTNNFVTLGIVPRKKDQKKLAATPGKVA